MAPGKRQVKARRHLVCNHCHSLVDFAVSGCGKTWTETTEEGFTFQCVGCWKVYCLTAELARLTDIVKGTQSGGRVIARTENVLGHGQGGSILVHVGTNNADRDGTTRIVKRYRELVETLKKTRVEQIILSGILPVLRGRGTTFRNCKRMAINGLLEQMCEEEGVGFVDLWGYFVGKEDMFMRDGLHLSGKGAAVFSENLLRSMNNGTGCNFLN